MKVPILDRDIGPHSLANFAIVEREVIVVLLSGELTQPIGYSSINDHAGSSQ